MACPAPHSHRRILVRTLTPLALWLCLGVAGAAQVEVAGELERLMAQYGFQMKPADLEATRDKQGRAAEGTELLPHLRALLEGFDHIIVQSGQGGVERVLILGAKTPYTPPAPAAAAPAAPPAGEITLETQRIGSSHAVTLMLEGQNGRRVQRQLLVDTGADYVVLPTSLIGQLGLAPDALHTQQVQTANGNVEAALGTLPAVWLQQQRVAEVPVAFIEDARLGGNALLGMSLLGRFRVTIEDEQNRLVLGPK
ncbi:TIGR02281 family clan AA aspartic protease [uncultured Thiodictyon sp.]|uniref:retropepsin-like aspartic protease family protein n=1 Tax=uncultured Thiodictyon sp. TaxID=1846217 RepID=UPI0025E8C5B3|nr:retropepsin-like aspartic protease [uncultured Thiodictyon sp.]